MSYSSSYLRMVETATADLNRQREAEYESSSTRIRSEGCEVHPSQTNRQIEPNALMRLVTTAITRGGKQLPWFEYHKRAILNEEGGWEGVHGTVLALTLGLMAQDHTLALADACLRAGEEWRKSIRGQWEGRSPDSTQSVTDVSRIVHATDIVLTKHDSPPFTKHMTDPSTDTQHPSWMTDRVAILHPRLIQAWGTATEGERELLAHIAEGVPIALAGELCGGAANRADLPGNNLAQKRMKKVRARARGAAV